MSYTRIRAHEREDDDWFDTPELLRVGGYRIESTNSYIGIAINSTTSISSTHSRQLTSVSHNPNSIPASTSNGRGASARAISTLKFIPITQLSERDERCPICLDPLADHNTEGPNGTAFTYESQGLGMSRRSPNALQLPCGHVFGPICITKWLQKNHTCPSCRFELELGTIEQDHPTLHEPELDSFRIWMSSFPERQILSNTESLAIGRENNPSTQRDPLEYVHASGVSGHYPPANNLNGPAPGLVSHNLPLQQNYPTTSTLRFTMANPVDRDWRPIPQFAMTGRPARASRALDALESARNYPPPSSQRTSRNITSSYGPYDPNALPTFHPSYRFGDLSQSYPCTEAEQELRDRIQLVTNSIKECERQQRGDYGAANHLGEQSIDDPWADRPVDLDTTAEVGSWNDATNPHNTVNFWPNNQTEPELPSCGYRSRRNSTETSYEQAWGYGPKEDQLSATDSGSSDGYSTGGEGNSRPRTWSNSSSMHLLGHLNDDGYDAEDEYEAPAISKNRDNAKLLRILGCTSLPADIKNF